MSEQKVVDVSQWKNTKMVTLPSGAVIEVRRRTMQSMMAAGAIPKPLVAAAMGMSKKSGNDEQSLEKMQESLSEMFGFIVSHFVVSPKIVVKGEANEAAGEVHLVDVPHDDQMAILNLFRGMEGGGELKPFRPVAGSDSDGRGL